MKASSMLGRLRAWLTFSRVLNVVVLLALCWGVARWQEGFLEPDSKIESGYIVTASTGINKEQKFFYFLYHLNLFPVATDVPIKVDTADEAKRLMREAPAMLRQDEGSTFRSGDRGRTYLYFVDAWLHHRGLNASLKPAHALAFTLGLFALLTAFWSIKRTGAGLFLVLLLGSNPFQLFHVYKHENVFSWAITTLAFVLAIHVPLLEKRKLWRHYPWVAAAGTGLLIAVIRNFRSEPTVLLLGPMLVYLTATWLPRWKRPALVVLMFATLWLGTRASTAFIDRKLEQSKAAVATVGGSPYTGPVEHFHEFWHVIFCGLGDYDTKYGYRWDDLTAYRYAYPELHKQNPTLDLDAALWMQRWTYDKAGKYPVFFSETPHYHDIIRDKVLGDIKSDPWWFAGIVKERALKVMGTPVPVGLALKTDQYYFTGPALTWCCVPLLLILVFTRRWAHLKILLISLPVSIAPLAIYSGLGMSNYSCFHFFGVFLWGLLAWEGIRAMYRRRGAAMTGLR